MSQGFAPFYDVNRTYEDNYLQGPFGAFAEVMKDDSAAGASAQSAQTTQSQSSDQAEEFLGFRVNLPFGIPAGPLLNERIAAAGDGQLLVPSFQGSRVDGMDRKAYIADHVTTAHLVTETGAGLMEMNTSCPNEGHNRLLCHDPHLVGEITEAVKNEIGDRPLIVKLAYIPNDTDLETMVRETVGHGTVQGFSTINTISARLVDANGNQALPGVGRDRSGVCGNAIRGAGLDMVGRLAAIREKLGFDFAIVGVGGVIRPDDYKAYREAGANAVMSATGAMWDANLAREIKETLR